MTSYHWRNHFRGHPFRNRFCKSDCVRLSLLFLFSVQKVSPYWSEYNFPCHHYPWAFFLLFSVRFLAVSVISFFHQDGSTSSLMLISITSLHLVDTDYFVSPDHESYFVEPMNLRLLTDDLEQRTCRRVYFKASTNVAYSMSLIPFFGCRQWLIV